MSISTPYQKRKRKEKNEERKILSYRELSYDQKYLTLLLLQDQVGKCSPKASTSSQNKQLFLEDLLIWLSLMKELAKKRTIIFGTQVCDQERFCQREMFLVK